MLILGILFVLYVLLGLLVSVAELFYGRDTGCLTYLFFPVVLVTLFVVSPVVYLVRYFKDLREARPLGITVRQLRYERIKRASAAEGDYPSLQKLYDYYSDDNDLQYDDDEIVL